MQPPGVLSREQLRELIDDQARLITGWGDLDEQLQPNGFDLRLAEVHRHSGSGVISVSNAQRVLPDLTAVEPDGAGFYRLAPGIYHIVYAETVNLPSDLMALGRPRSSLTRSGVTIHTAVWDAGYAGRSTSLMSVLNPDGFSVQRFARVMQLVFFRMSESTTQGYRGAYQGENIRS